MPVPGSGYAAQAVTADHVRRGERWPQVRRWTPGNATPGGLPRCAGWRWRWRASTLVVLGVVLPALLNEPGWGLTPNTASLVSVVGLVGVMVGALTVGTISDYIGRRQTILWTVVGFSTLTLACAFAPNPWFFGLLRYLAGLGLGGVLPTALALVEARDAQRGQGARRPPT